MASFGHFKDRAERSFSSSAVKNAKHVSANLLGNLTEILHVLGEHTGMKTELYQTNVKSCGFIYRASFQHRLHCSNKTA